MNNAQITTGLPNAIDEFAGCAIATVTVTTSRSWWNGGMAGAFNRVVAVTTVHL